MNLRRRMNRLNLYKNLETKKEDLYSIFSIILLDREYFKKNKDIQEFIQTYSSELGYHFSKDYIFGSRYDVLAKTIKGIDKISEENCDSILTKLNHFTDSIEPIVDNPAKEPKRDKEIEEMIKRFGRSK